MMELTAKEFFTAKASGFKAIFEKNLTKARQKQLYEKIEEMQIELVYNAMKKYIEKRKNQGFAMTYKKSKMYEMGFEDAIEWITKNEF